MKIPFCAAILLLLLLVGQPGELRADVNGFSIFKTANYHQTSPAPPVALDVPNAYYFGCQLGSNTNNNFGGPDDSTLTNAYFFTPDSTEYPMYTSDQMFYFYSSPYFANQTDLDAAFMSGDYEFDINDGADTGELTIPSTALYSTNIPYFTGDTWTNMQLVDPYQPFTLTWNNFTPHPAASNAFIFIRIFDQTGFSPYTANLITPGVLSSNIPAGTLSPDTTYTVQIFFSNRTDEPASGFASSATGVVGFDNLTYATMVTLPLPALSIALAGTNVVLSWPASATNFTLQATSQLIPANGWVNVTNSPTIVNDSNFLTNAISGTSEFAAFSGSSPLPP